MPTLRRKLLRDIAAGKARFFAVAFLVFLGLALYLSNWLGYRSLDNSYKQASLELKYNDIIIKVSRAPETVAQDLAGIGGVQTVYPRVVLESGCDLPGGDNIVCQLMGMPTQDQPPVNQVLIEEGNYFQPGGNDTCLLDVHLADFYDIGPGAAVQVATPVGNQNLQVVGTVASAEFFIVSGERDMIASPQNYGVLYVSQQWLQESFGMTGEDNQFCFLVDEGSDAAQVMNEAENVLAPYGVLYASLGDDTEPRQLLDLDVQGFKQLALFFPLLFLLVAALSLFMILTRMVHLQRRQIGTMMALGLSHRRITTHYLTYAMLVGITGAVTGMVAGYFLAGWFTNLYAESIGIPLIYRVMDWEAVAEGLVAALAACLLASILPVRSILKFMPSQVMQGDLGEKKAAVGRLSLAERLLPPLRRLSITFKMPLRNLSRDRRRAALNIIGIVFAVMLMLVALGFMDTMKDIFDFYYDDFIRYDADAYYSSPVPQSQAQDLTSLPAVKEADPYLYVPCRFEKDGDVLGDGLLQAFPQDSQLIGLYDEKGNKLELPDSGALLSNWFYDGLGVRTGDTVELVTPVGSMQVEVKGFAKQMGGLIMFADLSWIQQSAGADVVNGAFVASVGPSGTELRDDLLQGEGIAGVEITSFTKEMMQSEFMGLMDIFAGIMIVFAVAMALALIYNTVSIAFIERKKEVSVMLSLGSGMGRIAGMFTVENVLVALIALVPGLVGGYFFTVWMMKSYSSEFFSAPAVIYTVSYFVSAAVVLVVVLLAEIPGLRHAARMDLAETIRDRST
ncbi:MAG: ABC transporter permease [Actinobacteria bacterium]|jgi:putative ABC transport system permease protein|nr:MAG: ABC transporter permease [Actinomycetota bacterium]